MKHSVPSHYPYCFHNHCVRSSQCMRYLAGENINTDDFTIRIINPTRIPADTSECPYFQVIRKDRMAWGVKNLLNKVPYKDGVSMRKQLVNYFGKTVYYRIYRLERPLTPKEQEYIRELFRQHGIAQEPEYERITEEYYYAVHK